MFESEPDISNIPLDLFIGLLDNRNLYGTLGIREFPFVNNYSRVPTTQMDWITPDEIYMYNASILLFPKRLQNWPVASHFGLWLSKRGDDCLCIGDLNGTRIILKDDVVQFSMLSINIEIKTLAHEYEQYKLGRG